jgi:hypothetical protein
MTLGVSVLTRTAPPASGVPTDTSRLFIAALSSVAGPTTTPTVCRSLKDVTDAFGDRAAGNAALVDCADTAFREGVREVVISKYTGSGSTVDDALASFTSEFGPGQVIAPTETPGATTYGKLTDHAENTGRFALCDVANGATLTAMETLSAAFVAVTNLDYGMLVGPWVNIPAPAGTIGGSARQVPFSAAVAGLIARADALGNPNRAAAGRDFPLQYVTSFVTDFTGDDADTALNAGFNLGITKYGVLQLYGFQTGMAQNTDNPFWQANASRARMWLIAQAKAVGENYMFKPIDGAGRLERRFQTDLTSVCLALYNADGLYGATPADAFAVTTDASINTDTQIAQGHLTAVVEARFSMHAKSIEVDLVSVPVTGRVSTGA